MTLLTLKLYELSLIMPNDHLHFSRMFDSAKALAFENVPTRDEVRICRKFQSTLSEKIVLYGLGIFCASTFCLCTYDTYEPVIWFILSNMLHHYRSKRLSSELSMPMECLITPTFD